MKEIEKQIQLYLVTDEKACLGRDFFWVVEEAVKGGVTMVQLREKELGTREFINKGKRLKDLLDAYNVPLIINDRVDVALAIDAAGVHVGQSDMHFNMLKDLLPADKITGLSVERKSQVQEAENWDVSYIAASPLFSTPSKTNTEFPWGMSGLRWMRENTRHPVVVIGGLSETNTSEAVSSGAGGIAVISAICSAPSPYESAKALRALLALGN
jgi:thiamine-phosphate pyrophosphorylase